MRLWSLIYGFHDLGFRGFRVLRAIPDPERLDAEGCLGLGDSVGGFRACKT